jgi:hypothetical protein
MFTNGQHSDTDWLSIDEWCEQNGVELSPEQRAIFEVTLERMAREQGITPRQRRGGDRRR